MRRFLAIGVTAVLLATAATALPPPGPAVPDRDTVPAIRHRQSRFLAAEVAPDRARRAAREFARGKGPKALSFYDVISVTSDTTLDLTGGTVDGTSTMTIEATQSNLTQVGFWLVPMEALTISDGTHELDYARSGSMVTVDLFAPLASGERVTLTFSDHGAPNCAPGFFGMKFCNIDPDITYFGGCDWVPTRTGYTYADLIDAFDLTYTLTFPAGYESASSAERTDAADNGDGTVTHAYAQDGRWGMAFAVAQFDVWTGASGSGVPSRTYTWPGHDAYGQAWADLDADIIDFYEARYADYSLGKIDAVQVLQELGGGFATPSAVFQYEDSFDADPAGDLMSESIFAHEIGHQWWAFIVPLAEVVDLYSPWLSEGFAEFSAYTYSADVWGDYYIDYYHDFYAQLIQYTIAAEDEQPISGMDTGALDDNDYFLLTYEKGAYVLRMLRLLLGDEDFYAGMRAFAEGPGTLGATTDSFQATMEESSGVDLEDFFQQWAWGTGWPHYTIAFETGGDDASGYATTVRVTQAQADLFAMPVPIVLYVGEDEEETHVETIDGPEHEFTYPTASPVRGVKLDPRSLVLARREPVLHGDFNGSGEVDGLDLMYLAFAYRSDIVESANNWIGDCDIDFDGRVDERDLTELTANFGKEGAL